MTTVPPPQQPSIQLMVRLASCRGRRTGCAETIWRRFVILVEQPYDSQGDDHPRHDGDDLDVHDPGAGLAWIEGSVLIKL